MRRAVKLVALVLIGLLLVLVAIVALIGGERFLPPVEQERIVFESLVPGDRPNRFLVCPKDFCATEPDLFSPQYDLSVETLRDRWLAMVAKQPRVSEVGQEPRGLQLEFIQRSKFLGFPDSITVLFIARGEAQSTLAIYSRSHYGYDDFGANRSRIEAWLSAL